MNTNSPATKLWRVVLTGITLLLAQTSAFAYDSFDAATGAVTIPVVKLDTSFYWNVTVTLSAVVSVGQSPATSNYDTYNAAKNQLTIPAVIVDGTEFNNVVVVIDKVLGVEGGIQPNAAMVAANTIAAYDFNTGFVSLPVLQVGSSSYNNATAAVGSVISVGSGNAAININSLNTANNQVTMPLVIVGSRAYNNVVIGLGAITCKAPQVLTNGVCGTPVVVNHTYTYAATPPVPQLTPNGHTLAAGAYESTHVMGAGTVGIADLRGVGRDDVIYTPSFAPQFLPLQPLEIWLNNGDGTWDMDGANKLIVGGAPKLGASVVRTGDLNGDGRSDILIAEGIELGPCGSAADVNGALCYGGRMVYLESQPDGKYIDASSKFAALNIASGNVVIGSMNGDGINDILVNQDGSLRLLKNDGHANFTEQTDKLPLEIRYFADPLKTGTRWAATNGVAQGFGTSNLVKLRANSKPVIVTGSYGWDWGTEAPGTAKFSNGTDSIRFFEQDTNGNYVRTAMIVEDKLRGDECGIGSIQPIHVSKDTGREDLFIVWEPANGVTISSINTCSPKIYTSMGNTSIDTLNVTEMINMINPTDMAVDLGWTSLAIPSADRLRDVNNDGWEDIVFQSNSNISAIADGYAARLYNNGGTNYVRKPLVIGGVTQTGETLATLTGTDATTIILAFTIKYGPNQYGLLLMEGANHADAVIDPATGYGVWNTMRLHSILKVD